MWSRIRQTFVVAFFLLFVGVGCVDVECGAGTHREGEYCLPNIPSACGEGTVYERGWCVIADVASADVSVVSDTTQGQDTASDGGL